MIDLQQYRVAVGIFNSISCVCCSSKCKWYGNSSSKSIFGNMLILITCICLLILQCGDVEVNPGPKGVKLCPQCNNYVVIRLKLCSCGFRFNKKGRPCHTKRLNNYSASTGRPVGTSRFAGFKASFGRPVGTTCTNIGRSAWSIQLYY